MRGFRIVIGSVLVVVALLSSANATDWVRSGVNTNSGIWGIRRHLLWAIPPAGFRANEPRGLIRLGYPVLSNGGYALINFIAIEPVVTGEKGYSELERSQLDRLRGKRIWTEGETNALAPGTLSTIAPGVEQLTVQLRVEAFDNGAHVRLDVQQRSDRPDEIALTTHREGDSAPLEQCVLTATMGNMTRTRLLWLRDEVVSSLKLYPAYRDHGFAPHEFVQLARLQRIEAGDVMVAVTMNEKDPTATRPVPQPFWNYTGRKVTQYWRVPAGDVDPGLQLVVNGRYTYWGSRRPIPGGIAFENFEIRQPFHDGQRVVFGITSRSPKELGFQAE